jgi:hypothetical protein
VAIPPLGKEPDSSGLHRSGIRLEPGFLKAQGPRTMRLRAFQSLSKPMKTPKIDIKDAVSPSVLYDGSWILMEQAHPFPARIEHGRVDVR